MSRSPPKPWKPGVQPTYTAFSLTVNVCQDEFKNVWSDHDFSTDSDADIASGLQHGGIPQVAHALLTEAVRREVFTSAMVLLSRDPTFVARWAGADDAGKQALEKDLGRATQHVITQTLIKMLPGAVAGVLSMLEDQGGALLAPKG